MEDKKRADIDLIVAASIENILMVEGEMKEVSEDDMLEALRHAHDAIKVQCQLQIELTEAVGKTAKRTYSHEENDETLRQELWKLMYDKVYAAARRAQCKQESQIRCIF